MEKFYLLNKPKFTDRKYVISGPIIEEYLYDEPQSYNLLNDQTKSKGDGLKSVLTPEQEKEIQERTAHRAKQQLRRLVNANHNEWKNADGAKEYQKFLTFTFAENLEDLNMANKYFTDFIKRFNYAVFQVNRNFLKYVAVHELQIRGAIHYHAIFFNLPYMRNEKIAKIWGHGFTKAKVISNIKNVGAYMAKYLTKQGSTARTKYQKRYFASRGLKKPLKVRRQETVNSIALELTNISPIHTFKSKKSYVPFEYKVYDLSKATKVRDSVIKCLHHS